MKVLQIPNYQYPHIGGIEQTSRDIANVLAEMNNVEQKIICFNEDARDGDYVCRRGETVYDKVDGIEVIRCGCFAKVASQSLSLTYCRELKSVINSFSPDVVILHYPNPFVSFFLLRLLPKHTKVVLYWHLDIVKQRVLGKLFHDQNEALCRRADKIIATSPNYIDGSKYLTKYKEKCIVIPSCIRPERFIENEYTEDKINEIRNDHRNKTICFAVGRHVHYKGMGYLVEACQYLDDNYVIFIGGKGELTESLKQQAKNDDRVKFLGRIEERDMLAYYKACDIFCFPSITKNEAYGLSLVEAMYYGKPVVTFTIPGSGVNFVSINGVTGVEVDNANSKAFAEGIKYLASDDSLRYEYGRAAENRCKNNFLFKQYKAKIKDLITNI